MVTTVSLYWLCPMNWRQWFLIVITATFLTIVSYESTIILFLFILTTYLLTRHKEVSKINAITALVIVIATLSFFKIQFFNAGGKAGDIIENVAIPLGLSYYSFRCAHFIFERYRKTIKHPSFKDYLGYMFFLPTLVIGPINRFNEYFEQTSRITWDSYKLSEGLERILFGYVKIAVLGNYLSTSKLGEIIAGIPPDNAPLILYLGVIQDGLTLYFLFAGFSDIAIGFALLLGFRIMENFDWPYVRKNISDFWRGWHISLSSWCRDYVYFPVLGATRNPYLATLASFSVIGLWHEISFRYICWGLYHGAGILIWRRFQGLKRSFRPRWADHPIVRYLSTGLAIILTQHYVFFGLVIVNQPDFASVFTVYKTIFLFWV
jgi:alginate O-acetyltransferase complex protein AlgI